jgi:hypothetical protein
MRLRAIALQTLRIIGRVDSKDRTFIFELYEKLCKLRVSKIVDKVPPVDARNEIIHNAEGTTSMSVVRRWRNHKQG